MPMQLNHFSKLDLLLLKLLVFRVFSLNLKEFRVSVFCTLVLYFLISFIVQFSRIFFISQLLFSLGSTSIKPYLQGSVSCAVLTVLCYYITIISLCQYLF